MKAWKTKLKVHKTLTKLAKTKKLLNKNEFITWDMGANGLGTKFTDYFVFNKKFKTNNFLGLFGSGKKNEVIRILEMRGAYDNY